MLHASHLTAGGVFYWSLASTTSGVLLSAFLAYGTTTPVLSIDGYALQLAGLLFQLVFALSRLRRLHPSDLDRTMWFTLFFAMIVNIGMLAYQDPRGFPSNDGVPGVHLTDIVFFAPFAELVFHKRLARNWIDRPLDVGALAFASKFPMDCAGTILMTHHAQGYLGWHLLSGLCQVGGAGWLDGLIWGPVVAIATTVVMRWSLDSRALAPRGQVGGA